LNQNHEEATMKITSWIKPIFVILFSFIYLTNFAYAADKDLQSSAEDAQKKATPQTIIPAPPTIDAKGYILMDANTGLILAGKNIDNQMPPASLTKLMTLYQIASALKANRLHMDDRVPVSEKAWRTGGSKMFIKIGDQVPVNSLIQGIAVVSGNDACVAIAEHVAGTEESFADLMNHSAKVLGMNNTHYTDATGLPDKNHYTSPRDLAILTKAIVQQFPEYYGWYSQKEFQYNGIKQPNRDILLWRDPSIEGMKTGFTDDAGYCLVSTASRNGMRLISVVMGAPSTKSRANSSLALLNYGYRFYETKKLYSANSLIQEPRVWFGKDKNVPLGVQKDLYVTLPIGQFDKLQATLEVDQKIKAPVAKGQALGKIVLKLNDKDYMVQPLVALNDDPKGGIFTRMKDRIGLLFNNLIHRS
jgi:D-alanyl-D-alanine carboxypeptidase (penicillin-binding protein 5/6)